MRAAASTMTTVPLFQCRRLAHHARWRTPDPGSHRRGASSRRGLHRVVVVSADGRFRDEAERRAAIDRLSPPSTSRSTKDGDDALDPARARVPPPKITRDTRDRTRPRRFKDALDADRRRKGGAVGTARASANDDDNPERTPDVDREALARELRERRRERRVAKVESEAADRLASIVGIVRAELGDPRVLISSSMDGEARTKRFAALYERLDGVGAVEIAFALVKYYWTYWDEAGADETSETEKATLESEGAESGEEETSTSTSTSTSSEEETSTSTSTSLYDEAVDEKTRRALLRAAQLRATQRGDEVRTSSSYYSGDEDFGDGGNGDDGDEDDEYGLMDAIADMVRSYFSVDVVKDDDGNEEMVVMTSPEFLGFLIVAVIVSSRLGRYLVDTYLVTPVDPLLR